MIWIFFFEILLTKIKKMEQEINDCFDSIVKAIKSKYGTEKKVFGVNALDHAKIKINSYCNLIVSSYKKTKGDISVIECRQIDYAVKEQKINSSKFLHNTSVQTTKTAIKSVLKMYRIPVDVNLESLKYEIIDDI